MAKEKSADIAIGMWTNTAARHMTKVTFPLLAVLIYSIFGLKIHSSENNHYDFMLVGSLGSLIIMIISGISIKTYKLTVMRILLKNIGKLLLIFPFLFGCYITFYQGFWGFSELSNGFSLIVIIKSVIATFLGFRIVSEVYEFNESSEKFEEMIKASLTVEKISKKYE